jgi:hypothetical protein
MIFLSSFVELLVVNTHLSAGDSPLRNESIFLITDNSHSTLLRHHLYWTDPFTVRNRIDNSRTTDCVPAPWECDECKGSG